MRSNLIEIGENEKLKISRELHDSLGGFLVPLKGFVSQNGKIDGANQQFWQQHIAQFEHYISSINENIYPSELLENNLGEALNGLINSFAYSNCDLIVARFPNLYLNGNTGIHIFRIIQETLVNVIKHAKPDFITISHNIENACLKINVSYQPSPDSIQYQVKGGRGKTNILHRLKILNAKYERITDEDLMFEKFTFTV
jgi:glucose-6-phosphate-specific signal transduction histidine kinase